LSLFEREEIRAGIERHETVVVIARRLGRHRCTIQAELARNGGRDGYRAARAQARADGMRARPKTAVLVARPDLARLVRACLEAGDSPMTIAVELAGGGHAIGGTVSHETIYSALYAGGRAGLPRGLHVCLHRGRRCRKHRKTAGEAASAGRSPLGEFRPIATRPAIAAQRSEIGHLEGDLILGAANRSAIVTVFDRTSRHMWLAGLPDTHDAEATLAALAALVARIPVQWRRSLTWDQGREMARWPDLETSTGITVYFADAHRPWQRPTNENGNGLVRRYVGKGTDLSIYTEAHLRQIENRINTTPRRIFGWKTAQHVYNNAIMSATR
jgi:IS30 family transposase